MSKRIQSFLIERYPSAERVFAPAVPKLRPRNVHLGDAVVRVVVGQMLSAQAARTIYARVESCAKRSAVNTWGLPEFELRGCGLSKAKTRTIREFGIVLERDAQLLERWRAMDSDNVMKAISAFWGMSDWTASILALFYLGHEDIFPTEDGSLKRALELLAIRKRGRHEVLNPELARPYRSYLALYLWRALDSGILAKRHESA